MERNIYRFILRHSWRSQSALVVMALLAQIPYYLYLDLPKQIINQGILGQNIAYPADFLGLSLDAYAYLLALCFAWLGLVLIQQVIKYAQNVFKGVTSERMLRRLRYDLYSRVLRFPLPAFRKTGQGEIIPMITSEVEPLAGFIGESFEVPAYQGGLLITTFVFLLMQNPIMAMAAVALYPLQFWLIPKLQRRVNQLAKERVKTVRQLAARVGESVAGVAEIHVHDAARRERADITARLGVIYWIRFEIFQRKFMIKFINNFIQQLGPFFFYSIGGYLVLTGGLDIGALTAALAAHAQMGGPWRELLTYYQTREDARIKYEQIVSQFEPEGLRDQSWLDQRPADIPPLNGPLRITGLTSFDDRGDPILDGVTLELPPTGRIAILGDATREELLLVLARLHEAARGQVMLGDVDWLAQPAAVVGRRAAYVGPNAYIFTGTLGENLLFGLRHSPQTDLQYQDLRAARHRRRELKEASASGNSIDDIAADWIDHEGAGASTPDELTVCAIAALTAAGLQEDAYQLGLRAPVGEEALARYGGRLLVARRRFADCIVAENLTHLIEGWHADRYNKNASMAENLLFGLPASHALHLFHPDRLVDHPLLRAALEKVGLMPRLLGMGYDVANTMVELFSDLPAGHEFFEQFSFISAEDLPVFQSILARVKGGDLETLPPTDKARLSALPFKLVASRHRFGLMDDSFMAQVVAARQAFADAFEKAPDPGLQRFNPNAPISGASILDNILFGKLAYGQPQAQEKIGALIRAVIEELDLRSATIANSFDQPVGVAGSRLNAAQRQKLALARALIKRPRLLLLNQPTALIDAAGQEHLLRSILSDKEGGSYDRLVLWGISQADDVRHFDRVIRIEKGRVISDSIVELDGPYDETVNLKGGVGK